MAAHRHDRSRHSVEESAGSAAALLHDHQRTMQSIAGGASAAKPTSVGGASVLQVGPPPTGGATKEEAGAPHYGCKAERRFMARDTQVQPFYSAGGCTRHAMGEFECTYLNGCSHSVMYADGQRIV